jgi:hypothetical protein
MVPNGRRLMAGVLVKKVELSREQAVEASTFSRQSAHRWR